MGLGTAVSLDDAARIGGLDLVLPTDPAIGPPDAVYTLANRVALVWSERPGLPADPDYGVGLLLSEFRGNVDDGYYQKTLDGSAQVTPVTVNGHPGYWISGAPHFFYYVDPSGKAVDDSHRIVGDTLIWADGEVTYRLESQLADGGGDPPRRIAPLAGTAAGRVVYRDRRRAIPTRRRERDPCATTEPSSSPSAPRQPSSAAARPPRPRRPARRASPRPPNPSRRRPPPGRRRWASTGAMPSSWSAGTTIRCSPRSSPAAASSSSSCRSACRRRRAGGPSPRPRSAVAGRSWRTRTSWTAVDRRRRSREPGRRRRSATTRRRPASRPMARRSSWSRPAIPIRRGRRRASRSCRSRRSRARRSSRNGSSSCPAPSTSTRSRRTAGSSTSSSISTPRAATRSGRSTCRPARCGRRSSRTSATSARRWPAGRSPSCARPTAWS